MTVTLSQSSTGKIKNLEYEIFENPSAQLWATTLELSIPSGLRETNRISNFTTDPEKELENYLKKLKLCMDQLKVLHPDLIFREVNRANISQSINHLHYHFAHSNLVTSLVNDSNRKIWEEFNVLLHIIESTLQTQEAVLKQGLPHARMVFTWNDHHAASIPEDMYKDFILEVIHGFAYANYSQIGRQIFEMFLAQDDLLADEHIQPSRFISGDTFLWFGNNIVHAQAMELKEQLRIWFEERKERFETSGLFWGDPKLSIGMIPVARLINGSSSITTMRELIGELSHFDQISSVSLH